MTHQSQTLMQQVSDLLQQFEAQRDYTDEGLTENEQQFYDVLNFVYDLLSRTKIISSITVKTPEEMKEPGFNHDVIQKFGITADPLADAAFSFATIQGEISLREILSTMIARSNTSMRQVCKATGQGYPNMTRYIAGNTTLYADNVEKAINHCLKYHPPTGG